MLRELTALARPLLLGLDPERAHGTAIGALKAGIYPRSETARHPMLRTDIIGLTFPNPFGMAAGFDKNGEVPGPLLDLGFGFTEVGSVTPRPQPGNPQPRVFRLPEHRGMINRLGFNNDGHDAVHGRLSRLGRRRGILGINVGANKDSTDRVEDYASGVTLFGGLADYITVNVSSPNTPGLRDLQDGDDLDRLLTRVSSARKGVEDQYGKALPLLLKVAPDLQDTQAGHVIESVQRHGIDALIVSNTTIDRSPVASHPQAGEAGGLSGGPLFHRSTVMLARMYQRSGGEIPLVGVGGVTRPEDVWTKVRAGATLVQAYTGLVYGGFELVEEGLALLVSAARRAGFARVSEAVGIDADEWAKKPI